MRWTPTRQSVRRPGPECCRADLADDRRDYLRGIASQITTWLSNRNMELSGNWHLAGHQLAVALLRGRNIWDKVAVSRNSRREAGCAQHKHVILGAQHFPPQAKRNVAHQKWGPFFLLRQR